MREEIGAFMNWLPEMNNAQMVIFTFFTWLVLMVWLKTTDEDRG
jgi:hypothetical protein